MVISFCGANDNRLLISNFSCDDGLALEDGFDGEFAIIFKGADQLDGCLILDILAIAEELAGQQVIQYDGLVIVDIVIIIGGEWFLFVH